MTASLVRLITPKSKDIGDFEVRRALPQIGLKSVGPWIFFDHFGPVTFEEGAAMDVRPHPHINLATVTYLFEGQIFHRDSLGTQQVIKPGDINLMVAGRGISHSERTPDNLRDTGMRLHGLQLWMALPKGDEEVEPMFLHYPKADIPESRQDNVEIRVMMGKAFDLRSPVKTFSKTLYAEAMLRAGASLDLPRESELAVYMAMGEGKVDEDALPEFSMGVINMEKPRLFTAKTDCKIALIGGETLGRRHLWWNFVSSRPERIQQAKADWKAGRFGSVPGDEEFIPLPEER